MANGNQRTRVIQTDSSQTMSKDDLFLLLGQYENTIRLNTTLLEQQNKLLEQHTLILDKQADQTDNVEKVLTNLNNYLNKQVVNRSDCKSEHSSLANKIYVGWVGMGVIVISLMTLLITAWDKFGILKGIAKHLGVG